MSSRGRSSFAVSCLLLLLPFLVSAQTKPVALGSDALRFEEGPGISTASGADFNSSVSGLVFQFHRDAATVAVQTSDGSPQTAIRLSLAGANGAPRITPEGQLPGISSYFLGPDASKWRTNLRSYSSLRYEAVYPGIDLVYYGNRGQLEYDFIVAPNHDPNQIALQLNSLAHATIGSNGDLTIHGSEQALRFSKPLIYQVAKDGSHQAVEGHYTLLADNRVGFSVADWDHSRPLIIDPILSWSTFTGAASNETLFLSAVDGSGNTYLAGRSGAVLVVEKLNPTGATVTYHVVLGSSYSVSPQDIKVSSTGLAYIVGQSGPGFPTTSGGYKTTVTSGNHAFFAVVNAAGTALTYGTYLAGTTSAADIANGVAIDSSNIAYVAGITASSTFPTTSGVYETTASTSLQSGFVSKINPTLTGAASLLYSTYLSGPTTQTTLNSIAIDGSGNAYVAGSAGSDFPVTSGAYQYDGYYAGQGGLYVAKLNATASALGYSAYLGPAIAYSLATDGNGDAYVAGSVTGEDYPTTSGAYQVSYPGGFVTELNAAGSALTYSTFLSGPSQSAIASSIAIEPGCSSACNAFVTGSTGGNDFPTTSPIQGYNASYLNGSSGNDLFVIQLNGTGTAAVYSTYLGGSSDESGQSYVHVPDISVTSAGNAYVSGFTSSSDFPVTLTTTPARGSFAVEIGGTAGATGVAYPTSLTFGSQTVTVPSAPLPVNFRNMGSNSMTVSIAMTGPFSEVDNCGSTLAGGALCTINVTYTPTSAGTCSACGTVKITQSGNNSPTTITLSGSSVSAPYITLLPSTLTFSDTPVETASPSQPITVTNIGNTAVTFNSPAFSTSGPFAVTSTCGATLAVKASCTANVAFLPTQGGVLTGSMNISSNASGAGMNSASLSGTGVAGTPALTLSSAGLVFNPQDIGTTSSAQFLNVMNTGNTTVNIYSVVPTGDYLATGCTSTLNPGGSCTIRTYFAPTASGTRTGTVTLTDSTAAGTHSFTTTGTGVTPTQTLSISPASLSFPDTAIGAISANYNISVTNTSNAPVLISRVYETTPEFQIYSTGCVTNLRVGFTCTIGVHFVPGGTGTRTGAIILVDDATGNPQPISLSGVGLATAAAATASPDALNFGTEAQGTTTNFSLNVNLYNIGNVPLNTANVAVTGDFQINSNGCSGVTNAQRSCQVSVTFTPTGTGARTGTLKFTNLAGTQTVNLTGTGVAETLSLGFTPASMTFQAQAKLTASPAQLLTIRNTGSAAVTVSSVASSNTDYAQNGACTGTTIQPNSWCQVSVTLTPAATGADNGTLTITSNATGSPQTVSLTGSGVSTAPSLTLSPAGLSYPNQVIGVTSTTQFVTLNNTTSSALASLTLTPSGDFAISSNGCSTSLAANSSCSIQVTFTPTVAGARTGTIAVAYTGGSATVNLAGFGVTGVTSALLVDTAMTFPTQTQGVTSPQQGITFQNTGNQPFTISSIVVGGTNAGDFAINGTSCPVTPTQFRAFSSCAINVTFTPSATGTRTGTITITDGAPGSPRTITLTGAGVSPVQALEITPSAIAFPATVNTTTSPVSPTVYVTNTGTSPVTISSVVLGGTNPGDFGLSNGCSGTVSPGAFGNTCNVGVSFTPSASGARTATLTITHSAPGSPKIINLSGSGVTPTETLAVTPTTLTFGPQVSGTTSASQSITVTNVGNFNVTFTNVTVTTNYALSNGCVGVLSPGSACSIGITFTPTKTGAITGTVTITDNATKSPQKVTLSGTGIASTAEILLSQTAMVFNAQTTSTTSQPQFLYYVNQGNTTATISSVTITGTNASEFVQNHACDTAQVSANSYCAIRITFTPAATGMRTATMSIIDNAPGGASPGRQITLSGTGISSAVPEVTLTPTTLTFATQAEGTTSAAQVVNLSNTGNSKLTISSIAVSGGNNTDFAQTNNCGTSLAAGFSCSISVTFSPTGIGARASSVSITDNATGSPHTVTLNGTGKAGALPTVTLTPPSLAFPNVQLNTASTPQTITVKNTGTATLNQPVIAITGTVASDWRQTNTCTTSLAVGATCTIQVTFTPTSLIDQTGSVSLTDNAPNSPQSEPLTGNGVFAAVDISPTSLTFPTTKVGVASAAQTITLENYGNAVLNITSIGVSSDYLISTKTCGTTLGIGLTCTVSVEFKPTATGSRPGNVMIIDNAGDSPQVVSLSGTGN